LKTKDWPVGAKRLDRHPHPRKLDHKGREGRYANGRGKTGHHKTERKFTHRNARASNRTGGPQVKKNRYGKYALGDATYKKKKNKRYRGGKKGRR